MPDVIEQLANQFDLLKHLDTLRRYLLPCVGFHLQRDASLDRLGVSRLGGGADVPSNFDPPLSQDRQLDFLLQVNLEQIPRHGLSERLPSTGLLSFFYDLQEQPWGFDPKELDGFRVYHFSDISDLGRLSIDDEFALTPASIQFWRSWSLPTYGSRAGDRLFDELKSVGAGRAELDRVHDLSDAIFRKEAPNSDCPAHRVGGHSVNVQGDMQLEAQLVMNGLYCGDSTGYKNPRRAQLEWTCEDWQLLLQLDSDDDNGFMWGDCGMLYYWMRMQDLERGDFSRAWMSLQCS